MKEVLCEGEKVVDRTRDVTEEATPTTTRSTFPTGPGDAADLSTREIKLIHSIGALHKCQSKASHRDTKVKQILTHKVKSDVFLVQLKATGH